jgi:hypothetical protein
MDDHQMEIPGTYKEKVVEILIKKSRRNHNRNIKGINFIRTIKDCIKKGMEG